MPAVTFGIAAALIAATISDNISVDDTVTEVPSITKVPGSPIAFITDTVPIVLLVIKAVPVTTAGVTDKFIITAGCWKAFCLDVANS